MSDRETPRTGRILGLMGGVAAGLAACAPPVSQGGFDAPDPASQAYAIERAARDGDRNSLPSIIEALESDDAAVRFLAINALERLTGTTMGYRYYDPVDEREAAVERWVGWMRAAERSGPSAPAEARTSVPGVHDG